MTTQLTEAGQKLTNADRLRIAACYHREKLPAGLADELLALADEWSDEVDTLTALDTKTSVPGNDAGMREALAVIEFAQTIDDHYDMREFLKGWSEGDVSEWPEFSERLAAAVASTQSMPTGEVGLREAAQNAEMYLRTGFINCERCGHEQPTANTDAEYTLRAALSPPTGSAGNDETGMREALDEINVHEEAENYELRADGDYTPNDFEKSLLEDFGAGLMGKVYAALAPPTGSAGNDETGMREAGAVDPALYWMKKWGDRMVAYDAMVSAQPPKAETPAGVGDKSLIELAEAFKASCEIRERLVSRVVELEAALSIAPAARTGDGVAEWMPIETAPKDGTALLLACANWPPSTIRNEPFPVKVGGWHLEGGHWHLFGASWNPTHWRILPVYDPTLTAAPAANGDGA